MCNLSAARLARLIPMPPTDPFVSARRSKAGDTPAERLAVVAEAAHACMSRLGYRRTQMADVAEAAALSPAALYSYAKGKEALLTLAMLHGMDAPLPGAPLPVEPVPVAKLVEMAEKRIARLARWPALDAAIAADAPPDAATLRTIAGEVYDVLAANREGIWLLDRLSLELPEMARLQDRKVHGAFLRKLIALISKWPASGIVPDVAARNAVEMMAWPAMHRHRDAWLSPTAGEAAIRETAIRQYAALLGAAIGKKKRPARAKPARTAGKRR